MNREQAIKLLERLRVRTEARGATPAEAAQAAELAARIIERYKLDGDEQVRSSKGVETGQRGYSAWIMFLACAVRKKFSLESDIIRRYGERVLVRFTGPEHAVSVAIWLFRAIEIDMRRFSTEEATKLGMRGGTLVQFRNKFMETCAVAMFGRLNPPTAAEKAEVAQYVEDQSSRRRKCKPKRLTKLQHERNVISMQAFRAGYDAAQKIQLSTDVVGRSSKPVLISQSNRETT